MKRYNIFNYGVTWLGFIRIAVAIYACVWIYRIINSSESIILKIFLILVCCLGIFGCLVEGIPNIKSGICKAKDHSQDFIWGRDPNPNYYKNKQKDK